MKKINFLYNFAIVALLSFAGGSVFQVKAVPGDFDLTFGTSSLYTDGIPNPNPPFLQNTDFADSKLLADGSLISLGTFTGADASGFGGSVYDLYLQKLRPNGTLDPSFGTNGSTRIHLWEGRTFGTALKIQPDTKILVAGYCYIATGNGTPQQHVSGFGLCAMRFMPDGTLDGSFGGNAVAVPELSFAYNMPAGTVYFSSNQNGSEGSSNSGANTVDIASNGDIILAGISHFQNDPSFPNTSSNYATVIRLNSSGAFLNITRVSDPVDPTGSRQKPREFNAIAIQSDGKVIAVGRSYKSETVGDTQRLIVMRISTGGVVENTFVGDAVGGGNTNALSVTFTRSNKFLVGGGFGNTALLYRFNSDFTPDAGFGTSGKISYCYNGQSGCPDKYTAYHQRSFIKVGAIQPDGKILALMGGYAPGLSYNFIARFNPDGSYDRSFGGEPRSSTSIYEHGYVNTNPIVNNQNIAYSPNSLVIRPNGKILSAGSTPNGNSGLRQGAVTQLLNTSRNGGTFSDLNDDGKSEIAVYRNSDGVWHSLDFSGGYTPVQFGLNGDNLAPADYDGDGKADRAVFRNGIWYIFQSSNNQVRFAQWGQAGDLPRPGDFNGDGFADIAVFRPSNGVWYIQYSNPIQPGNITFNVVQFGQNGDAPLLADFEGDGKSDVSVFRNGVWYFIRSSDGSIGIVNFGLAGDIPVVGDYDGDGRSDIAVFRNGVWYAVRSSDNSILIAQFGIDGDKPVPGDYDGDGKNDLAIYRNGVWWILRSSDGAVSTTNFGLATDTPIQSAYLP